MDDPESKPSKSPWERLGPMIWARFRALGVEDARVATGEWLRSHGSASRSVLLADSIRWALTTKQSEPDPQALEALGITEAQLELLRGGDPDVFLTLADGFEEGAAAKAVGGTISALEAKLKKLGEDWEAAGEPMPDGSQPDGHPDTLRMAALLQEELGPMAAGQIEDHIEKCSFCTHRYLAWMALGERFAQLQEPPPPPKKSYTAAAIMLVAAGTASALAVLAVAAFLWFNWSRRVDEQTWHGEPAVVELVSNSHAVTDPGVGQTVSVRFRARYATHYALVRARGQSLEVLHKGTVSQPAGEELAPIDLVVEPADRGVWIVLAEHPLTAQQIAAATDGAAPAGVVATWQEF